MSAKTILILSANPKGTDPLRLNQEVEEIKEGFERSQCRDRFKIERAGALTPRALQRAMMTHRPHIVHFCGHGGKEHGLVLEDKNGKPQFVKAEALANLFELFSDTVEYVVLNACYSEVQAKAISQHINTVVGMTKAIGDEAAIEYVVGFYDALGDGRDVAFAHKLGCNSLMMQHVDEAHTPVLIHRDEAQRAPARIFISYKRDVVPDEGLAEDIYRALSPQDSVFLDRTMKVGTEWVQRIDTELQQSDFLIVLLSEHSAHSQMVAREIETAHMLRQSGGRPTILPVRVAYREPFDYQLGKFLDPLQWAFWDGAEDTPQLIEQLRQAIAGKPLPIDTEAAKTQLIQVSTPEIPKPTPVAQPTVGKGVPIGRLKRPGGTMRTASKFYISRQQDDIALEAIEDVGVTITIKGPRQVGKSSLLVRIVNRAIQFEKQVVLLDFQKFAKSTLQDADVFFYQFCLAITDELDLEDRVADYWQRDEGNLQRCSRYFQRHLLRQLEQPLLLAMDEVESLCDTSFRNDFFKMLRLWHNDRAMSPLWGKLDLVFVTSTEPYQLIKDLNQSPFNVGEMLEMGDFTPEQVHDLNGRYGSPFDVAQEKKLVAQLNGHPFLTQEALYFVARQRMTVAELFQSASDEKGPFGHHLNNHLSRIYKHPHLVEGLLEIIRSHRCADEEIFFRLRDAGLVRRDGKAIVPRCLVYANFFENYLNG